MGYWPRAELVYGIDLPDIIEADWYEDDAPEEAGTRAIRDFASGNTCGVVRMPNGKLRLCVKYFQADGGRGGEPQNINAHELAIWPSATTDLMEAAAALNVNTEGLAPNWQLVASIV